MRSVKFPRPGYYIQTHKFPKTKRIFSSSRPVQSPPRKMRAGFFKKSRCSKKRKDNQQTIHNSKKETPMKNARTNINQSKKQRSSIHKIIIDIPKNEEVQHSPKHLMPSSILRDHPKKGTPRKVTHRKKTSKPSGP